MKSILAIFIAGAIFAVPCATNIFSTEPSPLAGAMALAAANP